MGQVAANRDSLLTLAQRLRMLDSVAAQVGFGRVLRDLTILAGSRAEFCDRDRSARSDWLEISELLLKAEELANHLEA